MSELGRSAKGAYFVVVSVQGDCTNYMPPLEPHWRGVEHPGPKSCQNRASENGYICGLFPVICYD